MKRREFIVLLGGVAAGWPLAAQAQQSDRMRRLGVLMAVAESDADARKGIGILQERLQKLGWKDGILRIDYRWGNGNPDLLTKADVRPPGNGCGDWELVFANWRFRPAAERDCQEAMRQRFKVAIA
jgi:hypothetical protein